MSDIPKVAADAFESQVLREPGTPPGYLHEVPDATRAELSVLAYGESEVESASIETLDVLEDYHQEWPTTWLNVDGVDDTETLRQIGESFDLPALILEDIQNAPQPPKAEIVDDRLFMVTLMPRPDDDPIAIEQVSIVLGDNHVVTFQQYAGGDVLDPVRDRIQRGVGAIRNRRADYLAYAILDTIVDSYLPILEAYDRELARIEAELVEGAHPDLVHQLHDIKSSILELERAARPQSRMVQSLPHTGAELFEERTRPYLQDCVDHAEQASAMADSARTMASSLLNLHLTLTSQKLNDVMKVLTIIATIFIPLTFVAGIYGMNFDPASSPWNMPELKWRYGYPVTLLAMSVMAAGMVVYFARKGWLGSGRWER